MAMCYHCRQQCPELADEDGRPEWHYKTIQTPCDGCGAEFSHDRIHTRVSGGTR